MSLTQHNSSAKRRRGVSTMLYMVCLTIFIMLLMLVVNYTYLVYSQLRTGNVTDLLARVSAPELLDDGMLDSPSTMSPIDDLNTAAAVAGVYLGKNNATTASNQQLKGSDLNINAFRVENVNAPFTGANLIPFDPDNPNAVRLNTLMIQASRPASGNNPLYLLVRSAFTPQAADIGTISYATLDSRLIGFEPTATATTPVMPIGILDSAWNAPGARAFNLGGKDRKDFRGSINDTGGTLLLMGFDQTTATLTTSTAMVDQIRYGLDQADINVDDDNPQTPPYFLGPVVEGTNIKVSGLPAQATISGPEIQVLQPALDDIVGQRRIFPLVSAVNAGQTNIVGFIAATVLDAQYTANQLQLELEPEFIIHFTAQTAYQFVDGVNAPVVVPENVYIHKLRLSR